MTAVTDLNPLNPELYRNARPELNGLPHYLYAHLRDEQPCVWVDLEEPEPIEGTWVVSRYDDVRDVAAGSADFTVGGGTTTHKYAQSNPKNGKPSLLTLENPAHKRVRSIVQGTFTPRVIKAFKEQLTARIDRILDATLPSTTFDYMTAVARRLPVEAIGDLLGVSEDRQNDMVRWTDALTSPTDPNYALSPEGRVEAAMSLWSLSLELAEQRRGAPAQDIVSNLVPHINTERLSEAEYQGLFTVIALGGSETTRNNLAPSVYAMAQDPTLLSDLSSPDLDWSLATDELTRWASPIVHFRSTATRDVTLHGQQIRAGEPVAFLMASGNFDERQFTDPLRLDLARRPNKHLSFGWGEHFCLGHTSPGWRPGWCYRRC